MTGTQPRREYNEESIFFDIAPDGDGRNRIYVNFYQAGTFSIEVQKEELERLRDQIDKFLGSRPHTPAPETNLLKEDRELNTRIAGFDEGYAQGKAEAARIATLKMLNAPVDDMNWLDNYGSEQRIALVSLHDVQSVIDARKEEVVRQSTTTAQQEDKQRGCEEVNYDYT